MNQQQKQSDQLFHIHGNIGKIQHVQSYRQAKQGGGLPRLTHTDIFLLYDTGERVWILVTQLPWKKNGFIQLLFCTCIPLVTVIYLFTLLTTKSSLIWASSKNSQWKAYQTSSQLSHSHWLFFTEAERWHPLLPSRFSKEPFKHNDSKAMELD